MAMQIVASSNLLTHMFEDELVILNLNDEKYYTINGIGARMWQILTSGETIDRTAAILQSEYEVEELVLRSDLEAFVQNLRSLALIEIHDD